MRQFVRAEATEAVVTGIASSSDSVKSITLASSPLTVHGAAAAVAMLVTVAEAGPFGRGAPTANVQKNLKRHKETKTAHHKDTICKTERIYCNYLIIRHTCQTKTSSLTCCIKTNTRPRYSSLLLYVIF